MTPEERNLRIKLKNDFTYYSTRCLKIRSKSGNVVPFELNKAQKHIHARLESQKESTGFVRAVILKGRQQGCSTLIGARYYHIVTHNKGMQAFILTHALDATQNLYKMAQRFYDNTPEIMKASVTTSNSKELIFGQLDSGYKLGTAENKAVGRSATIQLLHGSEVAFWNNAPEHAKGILQAIPSAPGTEIILESTANGVGNYFHQQWQKAEAKQSEYIPIFVPWFWQDEYIKQLSDEEFILTPEEEELRYQYNLTNQQLNWRRFKIADFSVNGIDGLRAFKQEYPCNPAEAFQLTGDKSYISSELVMQCRKSNAEAYGPLLIGVDPARFGDDRTAIIRRKGRVAYNLQSYVKRDTMEVTGLVNQIIQNEKPHKVFVDVGGLGAGVIDRLNELGYKGLVVPVNSGVAALNHKHYSNKRAEMWGEMKKWMEDQPCQIPDSDSLHADLCGVRYGFDSITRVKLETKDDMRSRGIRSSDEADALALTFSYPENTLHHNNEMSNKIASSIMRKQNDYFKAKEQAYYDISQR